MLAPTVTILDNPPWSPQSQTTRTRSFRMNWCSPSIPPPTASTRFHPIKARLSLPAWT